MARTLYELQQGQKKEKDERVQRWVTNLVLAFLWLVMLIIVALPIVMAVWTQDPRWFLGYFIYLAVTLAAFAVAAHNAAEDMEDE